MMRLKSLSIPRAARRRSSAAFRPDMAKKRPWPGWQVEMPEKMETLQDMAMDQYLYIPFLVGWTSINPSYFDVNRRGTRFWPIPILKYIWTHLHTQMISNVYVKMLIPWYYCVKYSRVDSESFSQNEFLLQLIPKHDSLNHDCSPVSTSSRLQASQFSKAQRPKIQILLLKTL